MTLAILATGDEIIHGDTLNTNGHEIAKTLSSDGVPLGLQLACSDKELDLLECIGFLAKQHDIILSIGGLGPTTDDRTRFAFAQCLDLDLIEYPEAIAHIQARLTRANLPCDAGNRLQALFPKDSTLLPNPNGTAMGCMFSAQNKLFILLPGPPAECLPMFHHYVLPRLQQTQHSHKQMLSWQLFGVAEGQVAEMLEGALTGIHCNTGYRLDVPYLEFKVRCEPDVAESVKQRIDPLAAPYIISPPKQKASRMLRDRLIEMKEHAVIMDRATGGVLETLLRCPQNTEYVSFYEQNQPAKYHFDISGLDVFWESDKTASTAEVLIKYHGSQGYGFERHSIPYRGHAWVLHYAAEWLSFRMLHLINQIHQGVG
jgi:nicotinamide-nucleotide amidase